MRDRDEKRALLARLDRQVKEQKLTPLEIQSLSSDRQNLTRAMHDVQSRYRAVLSKTMSLEIDLNKKIDEATALCGEYDDKAQQLGLLDGPVKGFEDVPFAQEVNGASEQPVPEGLAGVVKPALQALRTNTRNEVRDLSLQGVKVEEELTRIKEVLGDLGDREAQHEQELDVVDREKDQMQQVRLSLTHLGRGAVSLLLSSPLARPVLIGWSLHVSQAIDRETATSNAELDRLQNQVNAISATMEHALAVANHRYEQRVVECVPPLASPLLLSPHRRQAPLTHTHAPRPEQAHGRQRADVGAPPRQPPGPRAGARAVHELQGAHDGRRRPPRTAHRRGSRDSLSACRALSLARARVCLPPTPALLSPSLMDSLIPILAVRPFVVVLSPTS